jgi:hypothetical protein
MLQHACQVMKLLIKLDERPWEFGVRV